VDRDAITVLDDEHEGLQALFGRVSGVDEDRRAVLKQLLQTLSLHVSMEKQMLVPVVKDRLTDGEVLAGALSDYHDEVEHIQVILDRRKVNSPDVPDLVTQLLDLTEAHVAEAKASLFPALREALSIPELGELGTAMVSNERRLRTHPHPHVPEKGPLGKIGRRITSIIDRRRDKSADVGRASS